MSKATIGGVVGAVIGFYVSGFNPYGAQIGFMIGSGIGASFDTIQGRKVGEMSSPRAQEGEPIPLVFGTARVTGRLMSCGEPTIVEEGGKGGPQVVNETAYLSYSILICESSELRNSLVGAVIMAIQNGKIVYDVTPDSVISAADNAKWLENKRFYYGEESQGVDATEQMIHGVGNVPAYRGLCRMVVTDEDVTQHGGGIPGYEFVVSRCGVEPPHHILVTGLPKSGSTYVFAAARASNTPSFVGLEPSTGADIENGTPAFYRNTWAVANHEETRYSTDNRATWQTGTIDTGQDPKYLLGGPAGWMANEFDYSGPPSTGWVGTPETLVKASFQTFNSVGAESVNANAADAIFQFGGYYYRAHFRDLWRAERPEGPYYAVWDEAKNTAAGIDNNGACITAFIDVCEFNSEIYAAINFDFDLERQQLVRSINGIEDWSELEVLWDVASGGAAHQPAQLCVASDVLAVYCSDGSVLTSANGFIAATETGLSGPGNYTGHDTPYYMNKARRIAFTSDEEGEDVVLYVIGAGETDGDKCVTSEDGGLSWSDPITMPIRAAVGIAASARFEPTGGGVLIPDAMGYELDPVTGETLGPGNVVALACGMSLQEIIDELDDRAGIPTANRDSDALAPFIVPGYAIDQFMTVAEAKEVLRPIYRFACPEYDDKIRYEMFGRDTDFVVDPDDLIVTGEPSEKSVRGQTVEFPRRLHVQYVDPALGYKPMKQTDERTSPDIRVKGELVMGANVTLEADTAKQAAVVGLKVAWTEREDMGKEIALPIDYYADTIPSHTYTLEGRRFRITDMRLSAGAIYLTSVYDRQSAFFSNAVGTVGPRPTPPGSQVRGPTISMVMNAPVLRDVDDKAGIYWGACGPMTGWKGAKLQVSRDGGATWEDGPTVDSPAVMGELTATLPAASRYEQDNTNTLEVTMYRTDAAMDSTDFEGLMEERNVFAIMYPDGTVEIGQFETATETADRQWELTGLMRGRQDTVAGEHLAGAKFVLLTDNVRFVAIRPDDVGKTLKFRAISVGTDPDAAEVQDVTFTTIESLREWQPYYIVPTLQDDGGYCVSWLGRARLGSSRLPIHSQWFEGYRVEFTIGDLVHTVDTTAQEICVTGAALDETFGSNHGIPTITVRARSRVATNDDDFDSPPGAPTTDPNPSYAATIVGGPSDGYVGEPIFDALGPAYSSPFQAYGGKTEERFTGEIVGNVTCQSSNPGAGVMVGIPLAAETRNAATEMIPTGPDVGPGGPFLITDSVTISAKPTYSMMNESKPLGGKVLVTTVTTPARTTKKLSSIGLGGLKSRAGTSTDKVRCAFTVTDMPVGGRLFVGVLAAGADAHLAPGTGGSYAHLVTADGTYVVELDGATGDIEVFEIGVGSVATGTLPLTYAFDGLYRFAWSANDALNPCPGATVHTNMGNESWPDTPTAGFGGLLNADTIVPCGFDAAVGSANGYWLQGVSSLTEATSGGISAASLVYAYSAFGKSTGKWRIGMRGRSTSRLGFCKTGHTGLLGASGTADSIGFTDTRGPDGFVIDTSFGGVFNRITIPPFFYYAHPLVYFAFDTDAHTLAIYVKVEVISGDPTATYALLTTLTGIPSGTWLPAVNGAGQLVPEIPEPTTYNDWTLTL